MAQKKPKLRYSLQSIWVKGVTEATKLELDGCYIFHIQNPTVGAPSVHVKYGTAPASSLDGGRVAAAGSLPHIPTGGDVADELCGHAYVWSSGADCMVIVTTATLVHD